MWSFQAPDSPEENPTDRRADPLLPAQELDRALGEIEHTLEQMLALAQLSASDLSLDRSALQKTLERLQRRIDQIADTMTPPKN